MADQVCPGSRRNKRHWRPAGAHGHSGKPQAAPALPPLPITMSAQAVDATDSIEYI